MRQPLAITYEGAPQKDALDLCADIAFPNLQARRCSRVVWFLQ